MQIYMILDKIDDRQLFIPAFQREYVWKQADAKNLMASLIKEYPTGTMLTWETNNPPELKGDVDYHDNMGSVKLILDGQQRITTLYLIIRGEIPPYYTAKEIKHDPRKLCVNMETLSLEYYKAMKMEKDPLWVSLTDIFQDRIRSRDVEDALIDQGQDFDRERRNRIEDNFKAVENIRNRDFLEQTIPIRASIKEAIDIFYIVNASGVNLSDAELALAQISGYWPKARELFKKKLFALEEDGFVFKLDFIVYVLLGVLHHGGSDMSKLHHADNKEKLIAAWELLETYILDYVMNIFRQHMYVDHTKEINSVYALVPVIVYVFNKGKEPLGQEEIKKIKKWFYYSQLRQRYISQLPQKLDKDISIVINSDTSFDDLLNNISIERPLTITADEFVGRDIRHPLYGLMRWYFKSRDALCFSTGVGIRQNMGTRYVLEWDHIFPYSVLKKNGYSPDNRLKYALMQEITNRAIITQRANRTKSNLLAEDYLAWVEDRFPDALARQCIPMDKELWKLENFQKFLATRRQQLADALNDFLESITRTEETTVKTTLEDYLADDENSELEFKSSLRWSYDEDKLDTELEKVIFKNVAAFNNKDGGVLLIGVNDDKEVLGLEPDYTSLRGDRDRFELHLRNLLNKTFGKVFTTTNLTIDFLPAGELEVCKIEIKRGEKEIFLETMDKNGVKNKKFYVRSGNSSQEMAIDEASEYVKSRFNNMS